ncbi:MAG TPA: hypothetical protein VNK04_19795 [Gemmataceae bacterium]|jgi:hypothetical protein|nr:hypothetical protein [Gemmataceae bacterium]
MTDRAVAAMLESVGPDAAAVKEAVLGSRRNTQCNSWSQLMPRRKAEIDVNRLPSSDGNDGAIAELTSS